MSLFEEIRRRNVHRAAAGYIVAAWLIIQVAETIFPLFGFGDDPARLTVLALVVLFLPVMALSWVFELTPEGIKRESDVDHSGPADPRAGRRFDRVVMAVLAIAVAYFALDKFVFAPATDVAVAGAPGSQDAGASKTTPRVAVLPFAASSLEGDSGFFAAGVHEDLLTQLAGLEALRVISRASVEEYRDTDKKPREIGEELAADAILEGRIQSAGGRIRINVLLVATTSEEHLWAETYDRELTATSIFDVQADIARSIAGALEATLSPREEERLDLLPTGNMGAYRAYHRAMQIRDEGTATFRNPDYQAALEEAVSLDPGFTRAWAELAGHLSFVNYFTEDHPEATEQAEEVVDRLGKLAPGSQDHLLAQSYFTYYVLKDYDLARGLIDEALALAPSDIRLGDLKGWIQRRQGDFEGRLETSRWLRDLDPRSPARGDAVANQLLMFHRYDEVREEIRARRTRTGYAAYLDNLLALEVHNDPVRYADGMDAVFREFPEFADPAGQIIAELVARRYDRAEALLEALPPNRAPPHFMPTDVGPRLFVLWAQGRQEELQALVAKAHEALMQGQEPDGSLRHFGVRLDLALLNALGGDRDGAERLIARYRRDNAQDLAARQAFSADTCRVLGIAAAALAAANCIREELGRASYLVGFLEIHMPFYDPIRDDIAFEQLLAELGYETGPDGVPRRRGATAGG